MNRFQSNSVASVAQLFELSGSEAVRLSDGLDKIYLDMHTALVAENTLAVLASIASFSCF